MKVNPGTPDEQELPAKVSHARFEAGDRLEITLVSGGGYGDPLKRDPRLVAENVLDGLLSSEQAREQYGVVIDPETGAPDLPATEALRREQA